MNSRHILDALDTADERILADVDSIRSSGQKKRPHFYKLLATAACLCLICTGIWAISKSNQRDTPLIETQLLNPDADPHSTLITSIPTESVVPVVVEPLPETILYWEPYYNKTDMVIADVALRHDIFLFGKDLSPAEQERLTPDNKPQWLTLTGYSLFSGDGALYRVHLTATTSMDSKTVNITIGEEKPLSCYILPEEGIISDCRGIDVTLFRYVAPDGTVELYAEAEINQCFFTFSMQYAEDILDESEMDFASVIQVFAESSIGLDVLTTIQPAKIPEMFDHDLSHEEALSLEVFGSYFLSTIPDDFAEESIHHYKDQNIEYLSGLWTRNYDELYWKVSHLTEEDRSRLTHREETQRYDLSLYPIPRADSVPTDLREVVDNPIFYAEELSPDLIWARAYKTGDSGDSTGWRMKFSVLYGDMVIHIRTKAVDPDWIYKQLASFSS